MNDDEKERNRRAVADKFRDMGTPRSERAAKAIADAFGSMFPGMPVSRQAPTPGSPVKPAKVSCDVEDGHYVAVGIAKALIYAETPPWRRVATIKSNGKPIAVLFCFADEGEPWHPEGT